MSPKARSDPEEDEIWYVRIWMSASVAEDLTLVKGSSEVEMAIPLSVIEKNAEDFISYARETLVELIREKVAEEQPDQLALRIKALLKRLKEL